VRLDKATVGLYEADYEKFNVFIPGARTIMLPVPLESAKEVKDNWDAVSLIDPAYTLYGRPTTNHFTGSPLQPAVVLLRYQPGFSNKHRPDA
jgi:hypothetical protein